MRLVGRFTPEKVLVDLRYKIITLEPLPLIEVRVFERCGRVTFGL